jgi:transcriptional regulator with XRE-family HTH domain
VALTFKRQMARRHMIIRDLRTEDAAEFIGCTKAHLSNVLAGRSHPNDKVRDKLPELLGLPIEALLDPELLEGEYTGYHGFKAGSR